MLINSRAKSVSFRRRLIRMNVISLTILKKKPTWTEKDMKRMLRRMPPRML
jgi:hypothetical protein